MREATLMDAFRAEDRRQRGYIRFDRALCIYKLFFHSAIHELGEDELEPFMERYTVEVSVSIAPQPHVPDAVTACWQSTAHSARKASNDS